MTVEPQGSADTMTVERASNGTPAPASPIRPAHWLALAFITASATLPFLDKPFHIDDVLYLQGAYQILQGNDPYHGFVLWDAPDGQPSPLFLTDYNPPLWKYALAGGIALLGRSERSLHLVESLAVGLAAVALFLLARRFTNAPLWCVAMILWSPFFLPGQNVMLEGPVLAFASWAVLLQCRAWSTRRAIGSWGAGVALALAIFTKYTAGVLLPFLVLIGLRRRQYRSLVIAIPPIAALLAWLAHNLILHGRSHLGAHGFTIGLDDIPARGLTVFRSIGAVGIVGIAFFLTSFRRSNHPSRWLLSAGIVLGSLLAAGLDRNLVLAKTQAEGWTPTALQQAHYVFFTFHGCLTCLSLVWFWWSQRANLEDRGPIDAMSAWMLAMFVFNVVCVPFNAIRHLLFLMVPMIWCGSWAIGASRWRTAALVISSALGFTLSAADQELARTYRQLARERVAPLSGTGRGVWFTGNWGFFYYASQAGANPLIDYPEAFGMPAVKVGDALVNPKLLSWHAIRLPAGLQLRVVDHWQPMAWNPFRTVAPGVHYYAVATHALPWEILVDRTHPDEPSAWLELPPMDDVLLFDIVGR